MSFALLLLATTFGATVNADYLLSQYFSSSTCVGTAFANTAQYTGGCTSVGGGMFSKIVCSNASYGTMNYYSTNACDVSTQSSPISGFPWSCALPTSPSAIASQGSCVSGDYTAPTSGLVSKTGYTETTCPVTSKPSMTSVYTTDLCFSTTTTTSGKASCFNSTHASVSSYAGTGCSGTASTVDYTPIGCWINQFGSVFVASCVSSSGAASISVALLSLLSVVFAMATLM